MNLTSLMEHLIYLLKGLTFLLHICRHLPETLKAATCKLENYGVLPPPSALVLNQHTWIISSAFFQLTVQIVE